MPYSRQRSPTSPTSPSRARKQAVPPGFIAPPKPKAKPLTQMTLRELHDRYDRNANILASPSASTSALVQRLSTEQAAIEARLIELEGVESIRRGIKKASINSDDVMNVDEVPAPKAIDAKRRALSKYAPIKNNTDRHVGSLSLQEAMDLERQAYIADQDRRQRAEEKKRRIGLPIKGEQLSRQETEARMWTFMNYKPTDSDLEDMDDDDSDDDPAGWFEDDQDGGIKGQNIIEPDEEDLSNIIRVDESRVPYSYSTFYEPRNNVD
ncbi:hypothetical protein CONPUDRAFT_165017 [Coniophora puteana RWD-64-598 SS2]|uniref:Uncharacterized protein n=1 Tax=Coniophora puteana (strain RWD-64-598) TaxID=741705 RepID=A0A5M3MTC9_CONPW|nr:uncharacterized protein CONPUDRAFT_165017 [Coniophora puteana RWD-64-598 SS2]EIW82418.1 hypothetical protein CONPUDRAFT_165017 [Coniophora puteana RWD-64-598 SS2]